MKKLLFTFVLILSVGGLSAKNRVDSLLHALDKTIKKREIYTGKKEKTIKQIKNKLDSELNDEEIYTVLGHLFAEYRSFQMDSAYLIANKRLHVAEQIGKMDLITMAKMNLAEIIGEMGMYEEAFRIISEVNQTDLSLDLKSYYFHLNHSLYSLMENYSISVQDKKHFSTLIYQFKDSLLSVIPTDSPAHSIVKSMKLISEEKPEEALSIALSCYASIDENHPSYAHLTFWIAQAYKMIGDSEKEKDFLALSAINDIQNAKKEYLSLRKLAVILFDEGDISRAYDYTNCTLNDAVFCNARLRTLELSQFLPIISADYDLKIKKDKDQLILSIVIISVLVCILIFALLYIYKQLKIVAFTRQKLEEANRNLIEANSSLNKLNKELKESNAVKEEYISYVFSMCSNYIEKLEEFQKMVLRKLTTGKTVDLYKTLQSSSLLTQELKEFYRNFDQVFLNLYPSFISEFNQLLITNEQIIPKQGELLTPELRIFALVKLGIGDSVKIANFLRYNPQTVYNYKFKIKNKLAVSKEEFSAKFADIGSF